MPKKPERARLTPEEFEDLPADSSTNPEQMMAKSDLRKATEKLLKALTPREEKEIKMRFGLSGDPNAALKEAGEALSVTRERIRQIEAKALGKVRHPSRSRKLKALLGGAQMGTGKENKE